VKLATVRLPNGGTQAGRLEGDHVVLLGLPDAVSALEVGAGAANGPAVPLSDVSLAPPVPRPSKIICVGLNYLEHVRESGQEVPEYPTLFAKFTESLLGPYDPIPLPAESTCVDWEAELAVVVGRKLRNVSVDEARFGIAGYTIMNDVSVRDYQFRTTQWLSGKTFENSTPLGPAIVTPDEVGYAEDLEIRCEVDGEVMQLSRTSDLIFSPERILSYISSIITLNPGDVIATGTPHGVGVARTPPVYLTPGSQVRCAIEGIGELSNTCV
jgi:acylpyruvate hydrolase